MCKVFKESFYRYDTCCDKLSIRNTGFIVDRKINHVHLLYKRFVFIKEKEDMYKKSIFLIQYGGSNFHLS
jgi:hypothetical protein